mmetsp:Transcript_31841/g.36108  ORF Transcript_31841/g.36108 Transcript_31841/m.36108 type:complete len:171 (+) Transcript_31841:92-604(+)
MSATPKAISSLIPKLSSGKGGVSLSSEKLLQERLRGKRVALYFSAGWCPMCTSFEPTLLQFQQEQANINKPIELVYVASDRSESDAVTRATQLNNMLSIPFHDTADYKKKFKVWAGSECTEFGTARRSGIPALVVLDNKEGEELEFLAAESEGVKALQNWPLDDEANGIW